MIAVILLLVVLIAAGLVGAAQISDANGLGVAAAVLALAGFLGFGQAECVERRASRAAEAVGDEDFDDNLLDGDPAPAAAGDTRPGVEQVTPRQLDPEGGASKSRPRSGLVRVVPDRKRYHAPGCVSLEGRVSEELTRDEAIEEGFTGCSRCLPAR